MTKHQYLQKFQTTFMRGEFITASCIKDKTLWIGTPQGLYSMSDGEIRPTDINNAVTTIIHHPDNSLLIGTQEGLYRLNDQSGELIQDNPVRAICLNKGDIYCTDGQTIWNKETYKPGYEIRSMAHDGELLWLATDQGLIAGGKQWTTDDGLLSDDVRYLMLDSSGHLWIATASGISIFDRKSEWYSLTGKKIPYEDVHQIVRGPKGECWIATAIGAACYANGQWDYYAGKRWLPSDNVNAIAIEPDGIGWIGTDEGLSKIEKLPYDFERKAEYYENQISARHNRYGFVTVCQLSKPGDLNSFVHEASDNDGLWTALYIATESFCYAVTGDTKAQERARNSMKALMALEEKSTIPGFPARAIIRKGEERVDQSHGEWHDSADGQWLWKADTSSDEIDGHIFAYGIYYDLVADEEEKGQIAEVVHRIMPYIVDNDFLLIDLDGKPTRWGVWSPGHLNGTWKDQQGLNSLEILSHLKTAYHITSDQKFQDAYEYLIHEHHYALNTIDQKIMPPGEVNHSDDELAFIAYYSLLNYEDDPDLRNIYLLSLERNWQYERPEHCPLWNFIYGTLSGNHCDISQSIQALERIPMDLISWTMRNSHRSDIAIDQSPGRFRENQSLVAISPDERSIMKWNGNPYRLDGGNDGRSEEDGTFYLIAYWLGRHHRLIDILYE